MNRSLTIVSRVCSILIVAGGLTSCAQLDRLEEATGLTTGQSLIIAGDTWDRITATRAANAAATSGKEVVIVQPVATAPAPAVPARAPPPGRSTFRSDAQ